LFAAGIFAYRHFQPGYYAVWSDVNAEIVAQQRRGTA
jgi:branched-chain amino acid transport system permease protein